MHFRPISDQNNLDEGYNMIYTPLYREEKLDLHGWIQKFSAGGGRGGTIILNWQAK